MSDNYKSKFNVLEVFENNDYQNILMGTKKGNLDDVVVINVFKKGFLINDNFLNNLKNALSNLIHIEETDDEIIAVTEYKEGISFSNFLSTTNIEFSKRIDLIHQYLTNLTNYDTFDNYFTNIFVDENQIISKDEEFYLNELLILDSNIEKITSFDKIASKISSTIEKIATSSDNSDKSSDDYQKFSAFMDDIKSNAISGASIGAILNDFESIFSDRSFKSVKNSKSEANLVSSLGAAVIGASLVGGTIVNASDDIDEKPLKANSDTQEQIHIDEVPKVEKAAEATMGKKINNHEDEIMTETELDNITIIDETPQVESEGKTSNNKKGLIIAAAIIILAAIAIFALPNLFAKDIPPTASFERVTSEDSIEFINTSVANGIGNEIVAANWKVIKDEEIQYTTEDPENLKSLSLSFKSKGEYIVSLKVQDKKGLWSEDYFETIISSLDNTSTNEPAINNTKEKLDSLDIDMESTSNATYDDKIYRSGNKSIKLDLTQNDGSAEFMIKDLNLEKNTLLSMWILSDKIEPIKIEYTGYSGDTVIFTENITYTPKAPNVWDMAELKINYSGFDKLKLKFTSPGSTIWIDDIDTSSYK